MSTDHRLLRCKLKLHFTPKQRKGGPPKKTFKLSKLQSAEVKTIFRADLQTKLGQDSCSKDSSPEALWNKLKTAILQTSKNVLGLSTKKNKDWFDENNHEIHDLLAKKRSAHQAHLAQPWCPMKKAAFRHTCGNLQCKLRIIQTSGGPASQRELNIVQTLVTTEASMKPSRQCTALHTRCRVLCSVRTVGCSSQIRHLF